MARAIGGGRHVGPRHSRILRIASGGESRRESSCRRRIRILSEATKPRDLDIKRKLYAKYGVRGYWIADPDGKTIEVLTWTETGYQMEAVYPHTARLRSPLLPDLSLHLSEVL